MGKNIKNEWIKVNKSKRLLVFSLIIVVLSAFFGVVVRKIEQTGQLTADMLEGTIGGYFPLQILGVVSDMVLPIFATLLVCFLIIDEYNGGTLKLPLLSGHSRDAVISAKIVTVLLCMFFIVGLTWGSSTIVAAVIWGGESVVPVLFDNLLIFFETYLAIAGWSLVMFLVALFLQNSGIMIGVVTVILVMSSLVGNMFPEISKYILTYYFKAFASQAENMNLVLGNGICVGTLLLFGVLTIGRFRRMEICK